MSEKSKTLPESAPLMPTRASAFSAGLAKALKAAGRNFSDRDIGDLLIHTENRRQDWICAAIQLGIALLAKKEALGHGKFTPWLAKLAEANSPRVANLEGDSKRSLERYMYLARRYLIALDAGPRIDARHSLALAVQEHGDLAANVATLPALAVDAGKLTPSITTFVAGRSLRQLLTDLREAERDAEEAEAEEANLHDADTGKPVKEKDAGEPEQPSKPIQQTLWANWECTLPTIERQFNDATQFAGQMTSRECVDYWAHVEKTLKQKAEQAADYKRAAMEAARQDASTRSQQQADALDNL